MGRGIMAAIPIILRQQEQREFNENYFVQGFFANFDVQEVDGQKIYVLKNDLLINNYESFLKEFYDIIGADFHYETDLTFDAIPVVKNLSEFSEMFSGENRNNHIPFLYDDYFSFSVLGCVCRKYWLFYNGSYKAYLEDYSTLLHFEKVLAKAMQNPLGNVVKFGIFG